MPKRMVRCYSIKMYHLKEKIYAVDLNNKKVVLDTNNGKYYELNETAGMIFDALYEGPKSFEDLEEIFLHNFKNVHVDLKKELSELLKSSHLFVHESELL